MNRIIFILITIFIWGFLATSSGQSGSQTVPNYITGTRVLENGTFYIADNVRVPDGAELIIRNGAEILFDPGATVLVEGALTIEGSAQDFIFISSRGKSGQGFGFEISGVDNSEIIISYAKFTDLILPIKFSQNWGRQSVNIENCVFTDNNSGESSIVIYNPDVLLQEGEIDFALDGNLFSGNKSNIYIDDLESDILNLSFANNVITGNYYYGYEIGGAFNAPIYAVFNSDKKLHRASFTGNSIFSNFLLDDQHDTIVSEINFGITGAGDKFNLPSNYFGNRGNRRIIKTFDHFVNNNASPFLDPLLPLSKPSEICPGHIYAVQVGEKVMTSQSRFAPDTDKDSIKLFFNKPINKREAFRLSYHYYDPETDEIETLILRDEDFSYTDQGVTGSIFINREIIDNNKPGYLKISGMKDRNGFDMPDYTVGRNYVYRFKVLLKDLLPPPAEMITIKKTTYDSLVELSDYQLVRDSVIETLTTRLDSLDAAREEFEQSREQIARMEAAYDSLINVLNYIKEADSLVSKLYLPIDSTWEVGMKAGVSFYYGDLQDVISAKNMDPSAGVFVRYNLNKRWSAKATLTYAKISANDIDNSETFRDRGLSFVNQIYELSLLGEFNIIKASISNFIIPSVSTGLAFFYHNPYGKFPSSLQYELRSLGTAGEKDAYSNYQIAFPFEVDIKLIMNNDWVLGLNLEGRKTFTDYLDDTGYDPWVPREELNQENAWLGRRAGHIGNPSQRNSGNRGDPTMDWYYIINVKVSKIIR